MNIHPFPISAFVVSIVVYAGAPVPASSLGVPSLVDVIGNQLGFRKTQSTHQYRPDGAVASRFEFPFMVNLGFPVVTEGSVVVSYNPTCGGVIITNHHVLTAGQCVVSFAKTPQSYKTNSLIAVMGGYDRRIRMPEEVRIRVKRIDLNDYYIPHPAYVNDLAILTLAHSIVFSHVIQPVCLSPPTFNASGQNVISVGWGNTKHPRLAIYPRKVHTRAISVSACQRHWRVTHGQLCTYSKRAAFCREETGNGIVLSKKVGMRHVLVGIQSVVSCKKDKPVVNTGITGYIGWIKEIVARGASFLFSTFSQQILTELKILSCSIRAIPTRARKMYCRTQNVSRKSLDPKTLYSDPKFQDCITECLKENIQHHTRIVQFTEVFERFGRIPVLLSFLIVTLAIGLSMMKLNEDIVKVGSSISFASVALGEIFNMLSVAVCGEHFLTMSHEVNWEIYFTPWYKFSLKNKKMIRQFLLSTQKELYLSAWIVRFDMEMFASVVNTAYSFFNFLKLSKTLNVEE